MSGYTGGFNNATISDSYTYSDFERDIEACHPFFMLEIMGIDNDEDILPFFCDAEFVSALGRVTAYLERNFPTGSDIPWTN